MTGQSRLPASLLAAYAAPAIPLAVLTLPVFVYVPAFYAETIGLPLSAVAAALLFVRIADAVSDPVAGFAADRFPQKASPLSRFGRRRLWFAASIPVIAVSALLLFNPPEGAGVVWLAACALALSLGWTIAIIPLSAWGAEISRDYGERSRIVGAREGAILLGTVIAAALPALIESLGGDDATMLSSLGYFVAVALPLAAIVTLWRVPEPENHSKRTIDVRDGLRAMASNRPFLRLIGAFTANGLSNAFPASLFLFFVTYRLEAESSAPFVLLLYFVCGMASVPAWVAIGNRIGKHTAWVIAMSIACAAFIWVPLLGAGDVLLFSVICVVTGSMLGADLALPASIQADVIDIDTARTGEQRSGVYFAAWSMATKFALAVGSAIALGSLPVFGFDPGRGIVTEQGTLALALAYSTAPVLLKIVAIALMCGFPIDREKQREIASEIGG